MSTEPPEFWIFILSNILVFGLGVVLMILSYRAYQRAGNSSFRRATVGFALIVIGSLVEVSYEVVIRGSYDLPGRELLILHTVEGLFIAAGLATLFYSIVRH